MNNNNRSIIKIKYMNLTENITIVRGDDPTYGMYIRVFDKRFGEVFEWDLHFGIMVNHANLALLDLRSKPVNKANIIKAVNEFILEQAEA